MWEIEIILCNSLEGNINTYVTIHMSLKKSEIAYHMYFKFRYPFLTLHHYQLNRKLFFYIILFLYHYLLIYSTKLIPEYFVYSVTMSIDHNTQKALITYP